MLRDYWIAALPVCGVLGLATQVRGGAIYFAALVGCLVMWVLVALLQMRAHPATRLKLTIISAVFGLTMVAAYWMFAYRVQVDSVAADRLARAFTDYKSRVGAFPATLADADSDVRAIAHRLRARYSLEAGTPFLEYSDAWNTWKRYRYDFSARRWIVVLSD